MSVLSLQGEDCTPISSFDVPTVDATLARSIADLVDTARQPANAGPDTDSGTQISSRLELWHQIFLV
jgi:hypothetical protein